MSVFCRLCRIQILSHPNPITGSSIRHGMKLQELIFECTHIMLTKDPRLPQFLCDSCVIRLDETYAFIQLCHESEEMFTKLFPHPPQPEQEQILTPTCNPHEATNVYHKNNSVAIKLELEQEALSAPAEYSSTFDMLPAIDGNIRKINNKDWITEARSHRERQRLSTAKRRAKMTVDQRERERERARVRQAKRRANRSDEEIRVQRERDRIRQAMKRAKFREVEILQQQHLHQHVANQDSTAFSGIGLGLK
ncbi:uncharacterized protein LOC129731638 [Wyeomyia smithii]|uniref:uncharacterized protein LOC129731638 n=1 Tax=Wyeomyia smithii TaxID=174621 RepID=UPI002467D673|nr:uncharacterized protein LOC129731638 [Wyeomyia smithii]